MKKINFKRKLNFLLVGTSILPVFNCVACSNNENTDWTHLFELENNSISTANTQVLINVKSHLKISNPVNVKIDGAGLGLTLLTHTLDFSNKSNNIILKIEDTSVTTYFQFTIIFSYLNEKFETITDVHNDVNLLYMVDPIEDHDKVFTKTKSCIVKNSHVFNYQIYFDKLPTDDIVSIELETKWKDILKLESIVGLVDHKDKHIDFRINMSLAVYQNNGYDFDIVITFRNSLGNVQRTKIANFVAFFEKEWEPTIPNEYFDIEIKHDNEVLLKGIKPEVKTLDIATFNCINIPENVTEISEGAFSDPDRFTGIEEIYIPKLVNKIGKDAFSGCTHLQELDVSEYDKDVTIPDWIQNPQTIFNITWQEGYVWTKNLTNVFEQCKSTLGLDGWIITDDKIVTSSDSFKIENHEILGLTDEARGRISDIKIIRIPWDVTCIQSGALDEFKKWPYVEKVDEETKNNKHRQLWLNNRLEEIGTGVFDHIGINGTIFFKSPYLNLDNQNSFRKMISYQDSWLQCADDDEKTTILFKNCNGLIEIGDFCFAENNFSHDNYELPPNIKSIGKGAFDGCIFTKIKFPKSLTDIEVRAFANSYYTKTSTLQEIDLSDYTTPYYSSSNEKTYIRPWMTKENNFTFSNCTSANGTIWLSNEIWNEFPNETKRNEWIQNFKNNHDIPNSWECRPKSSH